MPPGRDDLQSGRFMNAESSAAASVPETPARPSDFIRDVVAQHVAEARYPGGVVTRFPPEPNGYLHIGHAKSICLNFGIALEQGGRCHLRMDDTNPAKEDVEYVEAITADVHWLIDGWADSVLGLKPRGAKPVQLTTPEGRPDRCLKAVAPGSAGELEPFFASDYLDDLYAYAEELIRRGKAYVCDLTPAETEAYRGAPDTPGRNSPYRDRTVEENLDLFRRMRAGEFPDGARVLRARIDMASPNIWLRDPLLYRIRHIAHHHAGAGWCVYPLYDYAHCLSDYLEGITHSICTLEFEVHRPLYDWILESLDLPRALPRQYEFAKLNLAYTIVSKRRLLQLVKEGVVESWDDPRMPTLAGIRRRGVPAAALRNFVIGVGVTKFESMTEIAVYENAVREELNRVAQRRLVVLRPLKIVLVNLGAEEVIDCRAGNHPSDPAAGVRTVRLGREIFIETEDFAEVPPPKYFRLKPGGEVRLKYAGIIKFEEVVKDATGALVEVRCSLDRSSLAGLPGCDRKVKGTIHWVNAADAVEVETRLYDRLFTVPEPAAEEDFLKFVNPHSLETVMAKSEPSLVGARPGLCYQFERLGYFTADAKAAREGRLVFNRTITLKDTWAK